MKRQTNKKLIVEVLPKRNPTIAPMKTRSGQGRHMPKNKQRQVDDNKFHNE